MHSWGISQPLEKKGEKKKKKKIWAKGSSESRDKRNWALQMLVQQCWADFLWRGCLSPRHHPPDKRWVCSPQGAVPERQLKCHKNTSALTATHIFQARRNYQTIFSSPPSLLIPLTSSPPALGVTGRSGKPCQHLAWACSITLGGADDCSAGRDIFFFFFRNHMNCC